MTFVLLDSLTLPGNPGKANEDAFACRERAAAVLDGATGLGDNLLPGPSDAAWLSRFGANRLMAHLADGASVTDAVTASLFDAHTSFDNLKRREIRERYEIPYASLMLVAVEGDELAFAWYGDCAALLRRADGTADSVGDAIEKRRSEAERVRALAARQGENAASTRPRDAYLPALRAARNLVNTPRGGYLFGPDVMAADRVKTTRRRLADITHLLLATDGFLALVSDYGL
jgi:serine/threonine protein phosphatase PrpC